jgi:hypothetical protein
VGVDGSHDPSGCAAVSYLLRERYGHASKGVRYFEGRQFVLAGRHHGFDAKSDAELQADRIRKRGGSARIVKVHRFDYMVYALGGLA